MAFVGFARSLYISYIVFIISPSLIGCQLVPTKPGAVSDEKKLLDKLMQGYDNSVRPVINASNPVVIKLSITLTQIFDMDEKNQVLTTNVWLDQEWFDELLIWNPEEFGGLNTIRLPCEKIWVPDIVLYNNADDYTRGYMRSKAMVKYDGTVFWPPPTKLRSTCPVDVTYFPFDDQTCSLKLGSWIYDGLQVDVTNRTTEVDLSNYVPNGEWELLQARIDRNVRFYTCCDEPFPDVTITLVMRRKTLYYMYNIVLPCMMMSVLTLLVFCLPPDSGEKIALGITVLLAFSVFMLAIAEKMPETSESIPLIGIYLTTVMTITSISVIMTVIVLNFHHRGPTKKEIPHWVRRLVLEYMAACSCTKPKPLPRKLPSDHREHFNVGSHDSVQSNCTSRTETLRLTIENISRMNNELKDNTLYTSSESLTNVAIGNNEYPSHPKRPCHGQCMANTRVVQGEILKTLKYILTRQEYEEKTLKLINEWRQIASVVDRCLFWTFLLGTVASSLSFLVIIPLERRGF